MLYTNLYTKYLRTETIIARTSSLCDLARDKQQKSKSSNRHKMKKYILLIIPFLSLSMVSRAQMAQFQALFIYNFAKSTNWPVEDASKSLLICVIGDNEVANELYKLGSKRIGARSLVVKEVATVQDIDDAQIVYLGKSKANQATKVTQAIEGKKALFVSGQGGQCAFGASICFVTQGAKLLYEISPANIKRQNLVVSQRIIDIGNVVS